jgi:hypothetical protein
MATIKKTVVKAVYPLPSVNPNAFEALEIAREQIAKADEAMKVQPPTPFQVSADAYFFGK